MSESTTDGEDRTIANAAADLASDLSDAGAVIRSRREVNGRIKERTGAERIDHDAIREGFGAEGWEYSRHLYFHEERLSERAAALAGEFGADRHLLLTEEQVMDRIVDPGGRDGEGAKPQPPKRGDEVGWRRGKAVGVVRAAFEADGWMVREVEKGGAGRTFYLLPLLSVISDLHPNGRPPFSTDEMFRYYVSQSIRGTVTE